MQISRIGIEHRRLRRNRLDHAGIAMPDVADIIDQIQIDPTVGIEKVLIATLDDVQWFVVTQRERWAQPLSFGT